MMIASFFLIDVGSGEAGQDVKAMSEDIDKDLQKLTNETKDKCASLESCLAQIEHYQKVEKNIFGGRGWAMLQTSEIRVRIPSIQNRNYRFLRFEQT